MNASAYLVAAYAATWIIHITYLGVIIRRFKRLQGEIEELKTLGAVLIVVGGMVGVWVFVRMTSLAGQLHSWTPPFTEYEAITLFAGIVAAGLVISGVVYYRTRKP